MADTRVPDVRIIAKCSAAIVLTACTFHEGNPPLYCEADASYRGAYLLGTGDNINVNVFRFPELSGEYEIDGSGHISLPLLGQIEAIGISSDALAGHIETHLIERGFLNNPSVSIDVEENRPFYVLGEVAAPGEYVYVDYLTVDKAIAMAGGFTYRANKGNIVKKSSDGSECILRPGVYIFADDIIEVPERFF